MNNTYMEDIFSQPESLRRCAESLGCQETILEQIKRREFNKIVFTGMGSSNYCSMAAEQYLVENGWTSFRYSASELLYKYLKVIQEDVLLVIISQSGESVEIVKLLEALPENICTVGITNNPDSTLARKSTYSLFMNVEQEKSVTTRTYMAGIAVTLFLAMGLTEVSYTQFLKRLLKVVEIMGSVLNQANKWEEIIKEFPCGGNSCWILGRSSDYGTALAGTLFFREVSRIMAISECCGEFRHGPFEVVDEEFSAIFISTGEVHELNRNLIRDIREKGGYVLVITDQKEEMPAIVLPKCERWYQQFLTIIPLQIIADYLAGQKGIRAGEFRWGSKITKVE